MFFQPLLHFLVLAPGIARRAFSSDNVQHCKKVKGKLTWKFPTYVKVALGTRTLRLAGSRGWPADHGLCLSTGTEGKVPARERPIVAWQKEAGWTHRHLSSHSLR